MAGGKMASTSQLFSGVISAAAREGRSAAEVQQLVSAEAARLGVGTSFELRTDVSRLYGQWSAVAHAARRLAAAPASDAITADVIGQLPYGAGLTVPGGPRSFHVRVPYTAERAGRTEESYLTLAYTEGTLPPTIGELRAEATDIVSALVPSYSAELVDIGDPELGEL